MSTPIRLGLRRVQRQTLHFPHAQRRMAHHAAEYKHIPFDYSNRTGLAVKMAAYLGFGFALPFVAVGWQWYKPGGYKNSSS
ncbi:hypothetical protein FB45DRAFT_1034130 [Roridomyces roridus]|uniref:Cytochrome c oxidase subunit 8, mitochondrial n=1 Tax=Roridomyces roridus TaxID=1738132 RepID=A0AAD7FDR3_9AGAR|nr:hypothetical protein FB45DRAFT_1034130 [Roridomyces roridus]